MLSTPEKGSQEQIKEASRKLVTNIADLQDCLCVKLETSQEVDQPEKEAVCYANDALTSFVNSAFVLQAANPRSIRDKDRARLLPGQHSGVYLQFGIPNDGTILAVNFKGGLRILSSIDLQDTDIRGLSRTHTSTTDKVLEQPVEINWQLTLPGGPNIDCWIVLNQQTKTFQLNKLNINQNKIDAHPTMNKGEKYFDDISLNISTAMRDLTSLVPSSS